MNAANRQKKLSKYKVLLTRDIQNSADLEVDARSAEEAEEIAHKLVNGSPTYWYGCQIIRIKAKAKVIR